MPTTGEPPSARGNMSSSARKETRMSDAPQSTKPTIYHRLEQLGVLVVGSTPEELGAYLKAEIDK
jgi:hypothetical protein